ncbi:MAG: amino acid adenylation domain-containing protein [Rubrivivax sp.]|nr:amino acid adenylation domain-containing protein [Rubrivivax sp.]
MTAAGKSPVPQLTEVDYDPFASAELARAVPTTEPQREVWLAVQMGESASLAYNESVTLEFGGALDLAALQNALLALSDRHEALRTTISQDGQSMLVAARGSLQAAVVDLSGRTAAEQQAECARLKAAAVEAPFDLANGPLVRAQLVQLESTRHQLILTGHHIVCDGWSFGVLGKDLMSLYDCAQSGRDSGELPVPDSFADYALLQLDAAHVAQAEADVQYWLGCFKDTPPLLDLPADRPRPAVRRFESRREDVALDAALMRGVKAAGAKHGASLFATLFSTFAALMARLARSDDVVVGISAAGQAVEGQQWLVGHCVNLLPVRLAIDVEQPVPALLAQGRAAVLDAYEHQSCTFGALLKHMKLPRDASRPALVPVVFNLDTAITADELSKSGLKVQLHSNPRHFENFEAFLNASQLDDGGVLLELQYSTALFDRATVQRWLALYRRALQRLVEGRSANIADMLAPDEADAALVAGFNRTQQDYEPDLRLGDLLVRGLRAHAGQTAVVFEGREVGYGEFEGLAWAVAHQLRQCGAKPGTLVGVCLERSVEMVAALVGTVLAGAAYVPLDPTLPPERLRQMADDAQLAMVVSRAGEWARAKAGFAVGLQPLLLDGLVPQPAGELAGTPADPAYVIFTSGSTGRPKGAMNAHRGIVNRLQWMQQAYQLRPGDRVMQKTPFTFDVSVWEFFWPFIAGATLVVARPEGHRDGGYLVDLIHRERVTVMHFVPSMLRLFLAEGGVRECTSLRQVVCSGEALPADAVEHFFDLLPGVKLDNLYGPTEAAVDVTWWPCDPQDRSGTVPIGRPIANTRMYVLDERLRPLPVGVPGDLYIGGVQVGMGYVARPELTAERFIADPFVAGGRMYKTGDVALWRTDGALIYLGRSDFQVKLRGYRIELGEIEAQLQREPSVAAATVTTWSDGSGDMRLVAYVVPQPGRQTDAAALRDFLRQSLPDYMVPQHVVGLEAMPLLSSGKVDRRALPAPVFETSAAGERVSPETATEAAVLKAMEEILRLPGIGVTDDFFALGGHSLLVARLTARLNTEMQLGLPMRTVFEAPTARRLAAAIESARQTGVGAQVRRIPKQADQSRAPLTVMQERIRLVVEMNPASVLYNTPSAHRLKGPLDRAAFEQAFEQMVARQPSLRTIIRKAEGHEAAEQHVVPPFKPALPFEDLGALPEAEREREMLRRMHLVIDAPMPIDQAPLFRAALYRLGPEEHGFLFMPHHIIWDGWSFDLVYQEMADLYAAALERRAPKLPAPPLTYVDYAHWHRQWLRGSECQAQVDYWMQRHAAATEPGALPTDKPRRAGMSGVGAVEWVRVDKALTERLRERARELGGTLNMLVMALYAAMLGEAVRGGAMVIGIPVRGRVGGEVESVMGFFNNLLPVPVAVKPELTLRDWLASIKKEMLDGFANQDVPFERLLEEPLLAARAHKVGLYQSLFSFQDARERIRSWGPLQHSSVLVLQKGATEDLGLWLMDVPNGLEGGLNFSADLFERGTIMVFVERLQALFRRVADNPHQTLRELLAAPGLDTVAFANWVRERATFAERAAAAEAAAVAAAAKAAAPAASGTAGRADAARTAEEARLAELWSDLLGIDAAEIRASDNFPDLGGGSLLFMRAIAVMERELGLRVEPKHLLTLSLGELAAMARRAAPAAKGEPALAAAATPAAVAPPTQRPAGKLFGPKRS